MTNCQHVVFFVGGFEDATQAQLEAYCTIFFLGLDCQWFFVAMVISHDDSVMDDVQGLTMIQAMILVLIITFFGELVQIRGFETCC